MKLAESGARGVFWRANPRGTQERRSRGGLRERGDWWIRWKCPHGHLHRAHIGPKSLAQREAERRRIERACPERTQTPETYLLADVIRECLAEARTHKRSYEDDARYGRIWTERFGGRTLEEVSPADLEKIRADRLQKVLPASVNREFAFLKHTYSVAIRDGKTERNPVSKIRMLTEPSGRVRYLTDEEELRLLAVLATQAERDRVIVLIQTGLRKSEFLNLSWKYVDLRAGVLTIPRSKHGGARHVPTSSDVRAILLKLSRPLNPSALVFPNSVGKPDLRWAERTFPKAVKAAGIDDFRFHDLRHTMASRLAMEGVDPLTIKELGGWRSLSMVQRYAHLSPSHTRQAIERLSTRQRVLDARRAAQAE